MSDGYPAYTARKCVHCRKTVVFDDIAVQWVHSLTSRPSCKLCPLGSEQNNSDSTKERCPDCGGEGGHFVMDGNGGYISDDCPTCSGTGSIQQNNSQIGNE